MTKNRVPKKTVFIIAGKEPRQSEDPKKYDSETPVWKFNLLDNKDGPYSIRGTRCDSCAYEFILDKLKDFEGMTWQEIKQQTHDRGKSSNHYVKVARFAKEAKTRYEEIFNERNRQEELFSLRLSNKERLFGEINEGAFSVIWYEGEHLVYPVRK